jgi:hypothetical protein
MKATKVYQAVNGQVFRTEKDAKGFYGNRFKGALQANILFKIVIDEDGNEIGEW